MKFIPVLVASAIALAAPLTPAKAGTDPMLGDIMVVGFNFCPRGWARADGQLLPINQNQSLFSLFGTIYGGDGRTTFALPDLRGRTPVNAGQGPGLPNFTQGEKTGAETSTMTVANMAPHSHGVVGNLTGHVMGSSAAPAVPNPSGAALGTFAGSTPIYAPTQSSQVPMADNSVSLQFQVSFGNTGGGQPMNNMQPYLALTHCVALQGIFPSRP